VSLRIGTFLTSEIVLGRANVGKALAFGMIVVVAVTMTVYALLQRRTSKWLR
jgi:putative spermidine/putrescine transport system permease protein